MVFLGVGGDGFFKFGHFVHFRKYAVGRNKILCLSSYEHWGK
jgi:hypothetical protein